VKKTVKENTDKPKGKKNSQEKISIPSEEWQLLVGYFNDHKEELKLRGIKSPTMLLRTWMLECYRKSISEPKKQ
jgi:hypothetical protein